MGTILLIALFAGLAVLFYLVIYPFHRNFRQDQVVWFRPRIFDWGEPWVLAIVVDKPQKYLNVQWIKQIAGPPMLGTGAGWLDGKYCAGSDELRPIRRWQRNKVDPLIMKYFLLNGY